MSTSTLQRGLRELAAKQEKAIVRTAKKKSAPTNGNGQSSRVGTVLIGGHFDPSVRSTLLSIRADHPEKTMQNLLEEALDLLFERYKKPQAARVR